MAIFETSLERRRWSSSAACGPSVSISPIWETSKTPDDLRTRRCSALIPSYSTGISQPANGTSLAPASTCASYSGVLFSVPASMLMTLAWGCQLARYCPAMALSAEQMIDRVRGVYELFNRGEFDAIVELADPDIVLVRPGGQPELRGTEALR